MFGIAVRPGSPHISGIQWLLRHKNVAGLSTLATSCNQALQWVCLQIRAGNHKRAWLSLCKGTAPRTKNDTPSKWSIVLDFWEGRY